MKHIVYVSLLVIIASVILLWAVGQVQWMPVAASQEAGPIDWLFGLHLDAITILYVLVNGIMLYAVFVFRRRSHDHSEGTYMHGNPGLEIGWTVIPLIVVLFFAFLGANVLRDVSAAEPDPVDVIVTARQWSWSFEYDLGTWDPKYEGQTVAATELNLPVNRQAHFILLSEDVTHSFWVPEFRLKQDLVPGQEHSLLITPSLIGQYTLLCAELCGTSHTYMETNVNVLSQEDFEIWVQKRLGIYVPPEGGDGEEVDPVALGAQVSQSAGCLACHSVDGSALVGPTWKGLFGKTESFEDGSTQVVDDAYLHEAIVDPAAKIVAGYANVMPTNFGDTLTEEEIQAIIAYIKSLQ